MATELQVDAREVSPSQDFLKENTVRFILDCIKNGKEDELPPEPIVRKDAEGRLVAIDGHNLLAVNGLLGRTTFVHLAENAHDSLPETSEGNVTRNQDLADKYESSLVERDKVASEGIKGFDDLVAKYPHLFDEESGQSENDN